MKAEELGTRGRWGEGRGEKGAVKGVRLVRFGRVGDSEGG